MTRQRHGAKRLGFRVKPLVAFAILTWLFFIGAQAQTAKNPDKPPEVGAPAGRDNLSDRLNKSNGVIKPQTDIDPDMQKSPPPVNAPTPVVPPPGSNGDRPVTPK